MSKLVVSIIVSVCLFGCAADNLSPNTSTGFQDTGGHGQSASSVGGGFFDSHAQTITDTDHWFSRMLALGTVVVPVVTVVGLFLWAKRADAKRAHKEAAARACKGE